MQKGQPMFKIPTEEGNKIAVTKELLEAGN